MSFENGSMSFRVLQFAAPPVDLASALQSKPITPCTVEPTTGFTFPQVTPTYAGRLYAAQTTDERKIPPSVLKRELALECAARAKAEGRPLNRKTKCEIAREVKARLTPTMPVISTSRAFVSSHRTATLFAEVLSDKQVDKLTAAIYEANKAPLTTLDPLCLAAIAHGFDTRDLSPIQIAPQTPDNSDVGAEFLTWAWYFSETQGGVFNDLSFMIEGPLVLTRDGQGAHQVTLKGGTPEISSEVKNALLAGKLLSKCKLLVARGSETWNCTVDDTFAFRGLKVPAGEKLEPISAFEERMLKTDEFIKWFFELYGKFISLRRDPAVWSKVELGMTEWIVERTARA